MHRGTPHIAAAICLCVCILVCVTDTRAQAVSARLEGLVQDQSQAVIPGVTVVATNEATNISYESVTNETGRYVFVTLPPGSYRIQAELPGFKRAIRAGVLLQVGDARTVNVTLEPGDVAESVTVVAEAPLMDLTTTKIGAVIETRQILDLPLNGRNAMMLFYQAAGVNPLDELGGQQQRGSVDGLTPQTNHIKVEGVAASNTGFDFSPADPVVPVPMEAVGEYRITTSGGMADAGTGSGAKVSVTEGLKGMLLKDMRPLMRPGPTDEAGRLARHNRNANDPRDQATPRDMNRLLEMLWQGKVVDAEASNSMLELMKRCRTGAGRIKGLLPRDTVVAHKTGSLGGTVDDVGVIYLPENAGHVAISVMTKRALAESSDVERVVAEIARYAYDYFLFTAPPSMAKPE